MTIFLSCFGTYVLSLALVGLHIIGHLSFKRACNESEKKPNNNKLKIGVTNPSFNHFYLDVLSLYNSYRDLQISLLPNYF